MTRKNRLFAWLIVPVILIASLLAAYFGVRGSFPRPYAEQVAASGIDPLLAYSVMKAESGFRENAVSRAGAVGVMQIKPSTAEFICRKNGIAFEEHFLYRGEFNAYIGCLYLSYLLEKFHFEETAIAAYNAGEGTVNGWLKCAEYSDDGMHLKNIPYPETESYVKKIKKYRKIYEFYYK